MAISLQYYEMSIDNRIYYNLKHRSTWKHMEVTPALPMAGQQLRYFMEYLQFFCSISQIFIYLFQDFSENPS